MTPSWPAELLTRPESTEWRETSRYVDVLMFGDHLSKRTDCMKVERFGRTEEGREMLLWILSEQKHFDPASAHASGKPVVLIINNIHGGEVCGKEASQMLARELTLGTLQHLLKDMTLLIVPIFNIDGNERIDPNNRVVDWQLLEGQFNPEGGVGIRYTARGIDLNRDYIKQQAVEMRNLQAQVTHRWRPHLTIDCHATDGSVHGYHLTYAEPQNPSGARGPIEYIRSTLLPSVTRSLESRTGHRTFFYGNFKNPLKLEEGWETYPHLPRFGSHYRGLTNRMDILAETYSYLPYPDRIKVTYEFLLEVLTHTSRARTEIVKIVDAAEKETLARGRAPGDAFGIGYRLEAWDKEVTILSDQEVDVDPKTGQARFRQGKTMKPYRMKHYARFVPTKSVSRPYAYVLPPNLTAVLSKLREHNIGLEQLTEPVSVPTEAYRIKRITKVGGIPNDPDRAAASHSETVVETECVTGQRALAAEDIIVRLEQPLGNLIVYLLEPESDDGLVTWKFFDDALREGQEFPVLRISAPIPMNTRPFDTA